MSSIVSEESAPERSSDENVVIKDEERYDSEASIVYLLSKFIRQDLDLMSSKNIPPEVVKHDFDQLVGQIEEVRNQFNRITENQSVSSSSKEEEKELERQLHLLKKKVSLLKSMFPFCVMNKPKPVDLHINWRDRSSPHSVSSAPDKLMHNLTSSESFNRTPPPTKEVEACVRGLRSGPKICLLCFVVLPENAIIKKSLLVYWAKTHGIGRLFLNEPLDHLIENSLIHPVYKDSLTVGGYWMHPLVRSTLIYRKLIESERLKSWMYLTDSSSEEDIIYDDPALFSAPEELKILHLGNWQRSSVRHIEIQDPDLFFKDMDVMSKLTYISLRGISLVTEVPRFITMLNKLEILDLRSCHNLEVLPSDIGNLWRSLTHFDISECYFVEYMPMAISRLRNLRVLKGFVVRQVNKEDSCKLADLLNLVDLMKLNIYTSVKSFPGASELSTLKEFRSLQSLTISWGGCPPPRKGGDGGEVSKAAAKHQPGRLKSLLPRRDSMTKEATSAQPATISFDLEKLDLQCVPETVTRDWLKPGNFKHLKKLYIRGGQFYDLGRRQDGGDEHIEEYQWNVNILRLKHLSELKIDYTELEDLFPKLICLEYVGCDNLKNFPLEKTIVTKDDSQPPSTTFF